ncbi:MAG: hypothetical protein GY719_27855 [bacterium]|nr:hypothetical protein [bacterium]
MKPLLVPALIAFAALAHGAVEPWALTAVHVALIAALVAVSLTSAVGSRAWTVARLPTDLPVLLFLLAAAASTAFSTCPRVSGQELTRMLGCAALFFLATASLQRRRDLRATAWALVLFGAGFATLGLAFYGSDLLGFRTFSERSDRLSLTFANPNHYAALLSMLACLAIGLAAAVRGPRRWLLILCALYLEIAVFFTASRGGVLALSSALLVLVAALFFTRHRRVLVPLAGSLALVALLASLLGPRLPLERLATLRDPVSAGQGRLELWASSRQLIEERPWTGWGLGTFRDAVAPHQPPRLADRFLQHAHNDYLELAAEAGLPVLILALAALGVFGVATVRALARADPERRAIGLGAFAGCVALLLHSIGDFNLHIPAVAWLFVTLAAVSLASVRSRRRLALGSGARRAAAVVFTCLAALAATVAALSPYLAARRLGEARSLAGERSFEKASELLEPAARWPLADPAIRAEVGSLDLTVALQMRDPDQRRRKIGGALGSLREACRMCSVRAEYFVQRAIAARLLGRSEEATEAFRHAVELAPLRATTHFQLAGFLLSQGEQAQGMTAYSEAVKLDPRLVEPVFEALTRAGWTVDRIRAGFPERADLRVLLAAVLERRSEGEAAIAELRAAYELEPTAARASRHLAALFGQQREERALLFAAEYREHFPADRALIRQSISIHRRLGAIEQAEALYRELIESEPGNPRTYTALAAMLCAEKRYAEAIEVFSAGEARAPASGELQLRLGLCQRARGEHHAALEVLMKASAMEPGEKLIRFHLGEQLRLLGLRDRAAAELEACLEIDPEFGRCRTALARLGT